MAQQAILAIDQGTTNTKALLFAEGGTILSQASIPTGTAHPQSDWAEQSPAEIWDAVSAAVGQAIALAPSCTIAAIGLTNQRESAMLWDPATGGPLGPCILWQCRRTSKRCEELRDAGFEDRIAVISGLGLDPLFSATKLAWLVDALPDLDARIAEGRLCAGTVDSWLVWKLTGEHATDLSNASRTQLLSIGEGAWDPELLRLFGVPASILPAVRSSTSLFGATTDCIPGLAAGIPVHAVMGDSHAALFGHGIERPGQIKVTIGTGSSLMVLTSGQASSAHGLSSTIAWADDGTITYALEGNIAVSGSAASFAANLLGVADPAALADLACTVEDSGGVCFLPALAGIGAPYWRSDVRGSISGMSLASQPGHIARAVFEGIALQIADVFRAMEADLGHHFAAISVDGGGASNRLLLQLLADVLGCSVYQIDHADVSALGVARMAGRAVGIHIPAATPAARFLPAKDSDWRAELVQAWNRCVAQASLKI